MTTQLFYIGKNPFEKIMGKGEFGINYGIIRQKESIVAIIG